MIDTWLGYRNHGTLPEPGGFNDQDPQLVIDDWGVMNARYSFLARSIKTLDNIKLPMPDKADDWMNL